MVDLSNSLKNAFNHWDIRLLVLISLLFQVLQILFASGRKRNTSKIFIFFTWSIYLLADWVAGFTLGLLCKSQGDSSCDTTPKGLNTMINMTVVNEVPLLSTSKHKLCHNYSSDLLAFWAPFLLLHLGGPDTITAFSMEDNSLWPRHLMGLLFQVGTAVYVVRLSLPNNKLLVPTILMVLVGIVKYCERTYALYCASFDVFRDSILKIDLPKSAAYFTKGESFTKMVQSAHEVFKHFKGIIVDQCSFEMSNLDLQIYFSEIKSTNAFKLVEYELSFLYDVLFTKAAVIHTCVGYALRFLCTSLIMTASVLFFLYNKKHDFTGHDVLITYILLGGAISLDILAYIILFLSKWTIVRLKELESRFKFNAPLIISRIISKFVSTPREWSGSMMQHSLVKTCLPHHGLFQYLRRIVDLKFFDKLESTWSEPIKDELKEFIFQYIDDMAKKVLSINDEKELWEMSTSRGGLVLEKYNIMDRHLRYSFEVRFEKSILMWHIATDVFYYTEEEITIENQKLMRFSKRLSDYMMYLLFMRLSMIPSVTNWLIMYQRTRADLEEVFLQWLCNNTPDPKTISTQQKWKQQLKDTCNKFLSLKKIKTISTQQKQKKINTISTQQKRKQQLKDACNHFLSLEKINVHESNESALRDAWVLSKKLKRKVMIEERWKMVSEIWVDMLQYAAKHCPGVAHAQALSRGGELLTFVSFLIFHMNIGILSTHPKDYIGRPSSHSSEPDVGNQSSGSPELDEPGSDVEDP